MSEKKTLKMRAISNPDPKTQTIFEMTSAEPQITGFGPLSYACGKCDAILVRNINYKQFTGVIVKCFTCGSFNEIPAAHHSH